MIQNIFYISIIILLFFFISSEEKINDITTKKNMKFLFLLVIIYFVYQNYNFAILFILLGIFISFNIDFKKVQNILNSTDNSDSSLEVNTQPFYSKFFNSELFKNYQTFKNTIYDYFKNKEHFTFEPYEKNNDKNKKENNSSSEPVGKLESLISSPSLSPILSLGNLENSENKGPFKEDIKKIREMYENVKMEINKIGK
jgi:hypothetical protein